MPFDPNSIRPVNFDVNKYKQIDQQMFGPKAFDFSNVQKTYQMQAQADALRKQALNLYQQRLHPPKPKVEKKSYQDAVDYIRNNKNQFLNPDPNNGWNGKSGAYQIANEIKNNPAKQAELKAQGYNVTDFINALYAGLSDGNYRSEREYNQHVGDLTKDIKARDKAYKDKHGMTQDEAYALQKKTEQANKINKPNHDNGVLGNIGGVFKDVGHDVSQKLSGAGHELSNIWKAISDGPGGYTLKDVAKDTQKNIKKDQATNAKRGYSSNLSKEVRRGANRAMDAASFNNLSAYQNAENTKGYNYNTDYANTRQFGKGGATDFITSGLGYLVPGDAALNAVKLGGIGERSAALLGKKLSPSLANIASKGVEGGAAGGTFGTMQSIADPNMTAKQRLLNIPLNTGLGAVADPLLHGAVNGLSKLRKPTEDALHEVAPTLNVEPKVKQLSEKPFENISPEEPSLIKLTKSEQQRMKNQDTFAANNADSTIPNTSNHIMSKKDVKPSPSGLMDKAKIKLVDNLQPLDWFDKTVEKVTDKKLSPSESSYTLGLNSRGSDMISKQILTNKMVNSKGEVIGKSLKDVTKELSPSKLKAFEDYLVNKHAITRMERGEKVYPDEMKMSPQKSEQIVKAYEEKHPEFKDLSKAYYEYNKQLGKSWLVDTGILSKKDWEGYLKANPNYVPNNRIFKDIERHMNQSAKKGFANQTNPLKKAVGSQRKIVSPIESTIEHTAQYVKTAKRNEVMQTLIKNIQKDPEAFKGWAEIVNTEKAPIKDTLEKEGIDGVLENINKGFDQKPDLTKGNIVTGIIDGQKVHVKVDDPQLLEALTNLTPKQQNIVVNFFGNITRVMKNLTTGINPVFSLTRNVFRDIPQAYTNSKSTDNPLTFAKDLVKAFLDVAGNREAYQSFKNIGGGHASPISSDVNLLAQSKRSILPHKPGVIGTTKHVGGKLLGGLENLNNAIEAAPRLAEFNRIAKNGSYDSKVKGLYEANDVTTNFNKYGDVTKNLDAFVPYLNAAVQGLDKLGRQFKDMPVKTAVKASAAITIPTIALYAVNHDNPNYKQLSNYIKDQNFLIPIGDSFIKIPKPRELGVAFGSDVERTLRAWADKDPHAFEGFAQYVKEMFWPPTRPITAPLSDIRANKNFMGYPIIPGDLQNLSPKYQYDAQTSEVAKKLGSVFNKSPKQIDYLVKSYGGVLGQLGIPATTKNSTIGETLKKQVTADPVFSNDILSHFYDTKTKLDTAHTDYTKQGVTTKDLNETLRKVFDSRGNEISDIRKKLKQALNNDSLTRKQREQKVRDLQIQINNIAKQTNQLVR